MGRIKCITFDKKAQDNLPQHIKDKMQADRDVVHNGGKIHNCTNCGISNVFKRKPTKPVSKEIVGYCKSCAHPIWV